MKIKDPEVKRTMENIVSENSENKHREAVIFSMVFGTPIDKYMHPLFGFDLMSFDVFIKTPDGTSTKEWVKEKYGLEGVNIILRLLHKPEETE